MQRMMKKFNFLLPWFFVFCLVIIFYLFFCWLRTKGGRRRGFSCGRARWLLLNSVYQFSLWEFMWPVNWKMLLSVPQHDSECPTTVDELYRNAREACGGSSCLPSLLETLAVTDERSLCALDKHCTKPVQPIFAPSPEDSSQVAPRRWQLEFKRRSSSRRFTSTPCNEILSLRSSSTVRRNILLAVVQKMLASDCVYHSMSISRFIHHL